MSASQDYRLHSSASLDDSGQKLDLGYVVGVIRRRILYFALPFLLVLVVAFAVAEMQQPLYRATGEILVESPAIPSDFVHPTITESPSERFELIKQRILSSDNLMAVADKYNLFAKARDSMPEYIVLALMRTSVTVQPAALEMMQQSGASGSAFTVSFDYEQPDVALKVTDEFIREILNQDSNRRSNDATEITKFLEQEVKRLQQEHNAVIAQIEALKQRPPSTTQAISEETKTNMKLLAELEAELVQKSTVYSDEYPLVKELKRKIAALKRILASAPRPAVATSNDDDQSGVATEVLRVQAVSLQSNLDEANRKLAAARLGESMEKNREAEHLQLIRQPELPHTPFESKKRKFFLAGFAIAGMIGAASIFAAETLNGGIRRSQDVFGIVDRNLIVTVPYLFLPGEQSRRRRNLIITLVAAVLLTILVMAVIYAIAKGIVSVDVQSWIVMLMPRH